SEDVIREILQLNDAEGVIYLPNEEIFVDVETPFFEGMIADRQPAEEELGAEQVQVDAAVADAVVEDVVEDVGHVLNTCSALLRCVEHLEHDNVAQRLEIFKLKARGRMMNEDEGIELENDSEVQEVVEVVTTTKLITLVVTAAATQGSAASATIPAVSATIPTAALIVVAAYTRRRKGVIIRDPKEELSLKTSAETPAETPKVKDKGKGIMIEAPKPIKKKDQIEMDAEYARKLQEDIDRDHDRFNKDVDWDAAMDDVNQKSSTKRRKLSEEAQEAEDLRKRLEVVEDKDDDVFVEATPLASQVPVVDYQIVLIDNKSRFKIIRADETHQLYISFVTLLKNFDREDLETLWRIRNQKSVHGLALVKRWKLLTSCGVHIITLSIVQLFLLVERRYPLSRFTLEQSVNVARLQVKEESKMSLELLSKSKDCYNNIDAARLKLKLFKNIAAAEDITK
nr:hypothetical protein [Tanacetum cinerariifolium]